MKYLALLFYLTIFPSFACGHEEKSEFEPFAEISEQQGGYITYELFFPFHDHKKKPSYLSNVAIFSPEIFSLSLSYSESDILEGYYSASLKLAEKMVSNIHLKPDYNCSDKQGIECGISFCLDSKDYYSIDDLLRNGKQRITKTLTRKPLAGFAKTLVFSG